MAGKRRKTIEDFVRRAGYFTAETQGTRRAGVALWVAGW